eukprot:13769424-Alexandrium_andersonii.AAC.1
MRPARGNAAANDANAGSLGGGSSSSNAGLASGAPGNPALREAYGVLEFRAKTAQLLEDMEGAAYFSIPQ